MPRWLNEGHIGYILGHYYLYPVGSKIKKKRYRSLSVSSVLNVNFSDNSHRGNIINYKYIVNIIHYGENIITYIFNTIHYWGNIINYKYIVNIIHYGGNII